MQNKRIKKKTALKKFTALLMAMIMVLGCIPQNVYAAPDVAAQAESDAVVTTDPGTADAWEHIMGTSNDGSRYAGRVWVDKSVYKDGDTVTLNNKGNADSTFVADVDTENGEYFQVVFSALGSSMSTNTTITANRPLDVVIVLDTSTSMATSSGGKSRLEHMILAANDLLKDLLALGDVRVSIVSFNQDSETVLNLGKYENGIVLSTNHYTNTNGGGVIYARDNDGRLLGNDSGYTQGTNLQDGIDRGMNILANAENVDGRAPVAIVLADGRANRAVNDDWYSISSSNRKSSGDAGIMLSTLLNAAYGRARVENNYDADMTVYGIGIDLSSSSNDYIFLNPGAENGGFNAENNDDDVEDAWDAFVTWRRGSTATIRTGSGWGATTWTFDHNLPANSGVTSADVAANINYVDNYQDVSSASLGDAFENIIQELATGAFNPISDIKNAATGVENTPLIYVDDIGQYMEIKDIQAVQVFGTVYNVTKNSDGTYSLEAGSGKNPTTDESWNTANDIRINVIENSDGTQQLRIYINQEILPILLDKLTVTTENEVTVRTLEEIGYPPLRVYYTVGIDSDILLSNGMVDSTKIDSEYAHVDETTGTISFYSNAFGQVNTTNGDGDEYVDEGDAHVGFVPSHENRYYYHQAHQEIFISATNADGTPIKWEDDMYGVRWEEGKYDLTALNYSHLTNIKDSDIVYTYVTFNRPTGNGNEAEEVTYLVYTLWGALKSAVTYYDKVNDTFLNDGAAIDPLQVDSTVAVYKNGKNITDSDLIAVLGEQSRRVSRLFNMFETKTENTTGTAETSYAPEYNDGSQDESDVHEHSEVIVWLGNNGKLTLPATAGIKVTKDVAEFAEGADQDEAFEIRVLLDMEYTTDNVALLSVTNLEGNTLSDAEITESEGKILVTVNLANDESAYILGVPGGTNYTVTEAEHNKYDYTYTGDTQTVAGTIVEGVVTNTPVQPGNLYITKEVVHAYGGEVFPTDYEFEFEVTFADADGNPIADETFELENNYDTNLKELTTDEDGVMRGKLRHGETVYIKDIPEGATVTVEEVNIPDNYTSTEYRSRNHSGDTADTNGEVTIVSHQNATVVVTNTYTPDEVGVDISFEGTKLFDATKMTADSEFTFKLQEYVNGAWTDVEGKSVTVTGGTNASEAFKFSDLNLEYDQPGVHSYQIIEVKGDNSDITYDRSVYTFSVNVTIDNKGDLNAEVVGHNEKENAFDVSGDSENGYVVTTVFTNEYHTTATSVEIVKSIEDKGNSGKTAAGFVVETYEASVDGNGNWTEGDFIRSTVTDAQGEALLVRNYDNTDFIQNDTDNDNVVTYHFIIKEKDAGTTSGGWTYDATEYRVTVVLTKNAETGEISADFDVVKVNAKGETTNLNVSGDTAQITFANTYDPADTKVDLSTLVKKHLEGRSMKAGEFTFAIFENGNAQFDANGSLTNISDAIATGTNDADGNVAFPSDKLTFTEVGKFEYDIVEVKGNNGGVTYDNTIYDLVVEVSDNGDGTLTAKYYFEDSVDTTVTFENTYTVKGTEIVIDGMKTLKVNSGSKTLKAGDYTFYLYDETGKKIGETTNLANGTFKFDAIKYTGKDIGKTYTYIVKEVAPDGTTDGSYTKDGVTWSGQSFTVTVEVADNGDGTMSANVTGNGAQNIVFVNEYNTKPVSVVLPGKKNLSNRDLTEGEFTFALYSTDRAFANLTPVNENITHDANGDFEVDLGTLGAGTHYFLLKEVIPSVHAAGIHYSVAEYHITIRVTDSGNGQMSYTQTVVNTGEPNVTDADIVFDNMYSPEPGEISLSGTKIYNGGKALENNMFSVGLYGENDEGEEELIDTAKVMADGTFTFQDLEFDAGDVGQTYTYTVKEIIPDEEDDNHDYDETEYTVKVEITDDDKDGKLEIEKTVTKGLIPAELTFTNTFIPDPIQYTVEAKKTYDKGLNGEDFEFKLTSIDGKTDVNQTVKNDKDGNIVFAPITFNAADEYKFKLTEKTEGMFSFIRPSEAEYEITVTVVNENGVLRVSNVSNVNTKNTGETELEFINTYVMDGDGEVTLGGTKTLTGDRIAVKEGEFEFGLYDEAGNLVESVKNDANGNFEFSTMKFDETDVSVNGEEQITYTVKEIPGDNARYTYDDTIYTVVITIKDNNAGGIDVSYTINGVESDNAAIAFKNTYTNPTPVTYTPTAKKNYNKPLQGGEFKFELVGEINGTKISQEKENQANGEIVFDTLSFPEAGTYTFKVKEINKVLGYIEYSAAEHEIVVKVIDTKGVLSIESVTINGDSEGTIEFTNTYVMDGEGEVTLRGTKTLTGGRTQVKADEFEFGLYDEAGKLVESVKNDANGNFAFSTMKFDETDVTIDGQKQLTYTVKEIAGTDPDITYDKTVYTVVVTVEDNNQGCVAVSYTVDGKADGKLAFTNTCTSKVPDSPTKTGDNANILTYLFAILASLIAAFVVLIKRRLDYNKR